MNGVDFPVARVLDGIAAAREAGLSPIKINTVVRRGLNEASILPLARWARDEGLILRFIEYMDVGTQRLAAGRRGARPRRSSRAIDAELPLEPVAANYRGEVAGRYRYVDGSGEVGVIASVSAVLRRLHAGAALGRGQTLHVPVRGRAGRPRGPVAGRGTDAQIEDRIRAVWGARADRYSDSAAKPRSDLPKVEMFALGG